jgi:hypothetical protein
MIAAEVARFSPIAWRAPCTIWSGKESPFVTPKVGTLAVSPTVALFVIIFLGFVDERLKSLQRRPEATEGDFTLSQDAVPIQFTYTAPQYNATPTHSVQRTPTVDLLLKSFDDDNQRRDSASVSMQLGLSVSQRASEVRT